MNVVLMMHEILGAANPMICESALPDFFAAADHRSECVRVSAFDQLNGVFESYVVGWRQENVNVFGHYDESVELKSAFATVTVESLQEEAGVVFYDEESATLPGGESYEVGSGRRKESRRLQEQTSAAKAAIFASVNRHEWNSCPSRLIFAEGWRSTRVEGIYCALGAQPRTKGSGATCKG